VTEPATEPSPPNASLWEDFIDIFTSPSAVFRRRVNSGYGVQLLVTTVIFALLVLGTKALFQPVMDAESARAVARALHANPQLTAEQMQKNVEIGQNFGVYIQIIIVPIVVLLTGLVTWAVGKLFESVQSLQSAMMVSTYAMFIKLPGLVTAAIIAYFSDPARLNGAARVTLGLGAFLDPDKTSPLLVGLLTRVDVFTIWQTILLAIGLQVTGKVSKSQSYFAAVIIWLIGALPAVLGALRS
jgi:hypothetical protein